MGAAPGISGVFKLVATSAHHVVRVTVRISVVAFHRDIRAWELASDGTWSSNGGSLHLQELLIDGQRRRRSATSS